MILTHFQTLIHLINSEKETISLDAGTFLYQRGEEGQCMYLVKSGAVKIFVGTELVEMGREGTIVGEETQCRQPAQLSAPSALITNSLTPDRNPFFLE